MKYPIAFLLALCAACGSTRSPDASRDEPTPPPPAPRSTRLEGSAGGGAAGAPPGKSAGEPAGESAGAAEVRSPSSRIGELAWLVGTWRLARPAGFVEETWVPPLGGAMLGVGRTVTEGRMTSFEFLRLEQRGDGLVYVAQPQGRSATEFELSDLGADFVQFENPRHDFPKWVRYERAGSSGLNATIGADAREIRFAYKRVR